MYERVDAVAREEALLADQLHQVGDRLQQPERARRGSGRSGAACGRAACARASVVYAKATSTRLMMTTALMSEIHQALVGVRHGLRHLDGRRGGRAACSSAMRTTPCEQLACSRARAACARCRSSDDHLVAGAIPRRSRVVAGELDLGGRALELQLGRRARRPGRRRAAGSGRAEAVAVARRAGLVAAGSARSRRPRPRRAAARARRPRRTGGRRSSRPRPPRRRGRRTARARRRSARRASRSRRARPGTAGSPRGAGAAAGPRG